MNEQFDIVASIVNLFFVNSSLLSSTRIECAIGILIGFIYRKNPFIVSLGFWVSILNGFDCFISESSEAHNICWNIKAKNKRDCDLQIFSVVRDTIISIAITYTFWNLRRTLLRHGCDEKANITDARKIIRKVDRVALLLIGITIVTISISLKICFFWCSRSSEKI